MSYTIPQVRVFQQYTQSSSSTIEPLRACIVGGNAKLHRFSDVVEKAAINLGPYDHQLTKSYAWPDRTAGGLVDMDGVRLYIEDALLLYLHDLIGDTTSGRGTVAPVAGRKNWVRSSSISFVSNGTANPRSALLNDRDVKVGDVVYLRGVVDGDTDCTEKELWTYVEGFAADTGTAVIADVVLDDNNGEAVGAATTISQIAGPVNCIDATASGTNYNGYESGVLTETYTITVIRSSVSGCNAARLRVTSASGTDDVDEVTPADFGSPTDIGTRGLTVTFTDNPGNCSLSASSAGAEAGELVVGQVWEVEVSDGFKPACASSSGTYTGTFDDTYIVEVTKGGVFAALPEITVTTAKGLDVSGPTAVPAKDLAIVVGSYGVEITFESCGSGLEGLRKGDKFYITVTSGANGPIRTLILRDDIPAQIREATDLDLRLFIPKTIEVTVPRLSAPPLSNYSTSATQITVNSGITAYEASWTRSGVPQPLTVWSGRDETTTDPRSWGILYAEYREWLPAAATALNFATSLTDLDDIDGQLDPDNPLKYGAYYAFQNSNNVSVGYIGVANPADIDSWVETLEKLEGRNDIYNIVPMTTDKAIHDLVKTFVAAQSTAEAGNWKAMVIPLTARTSRMVVGQSSAADQTLRPTSADGGVVLATLEDDPETTGLQFTLLSVPANNARFLTYGVQAGDIVRYLYTINAFGEATYSEFIVDSVLSESTLLLQSGHTAPIIVAQKMEIWHNMSKNEVATDLAEKAQAFGDHRVVATWPDVAGNAGVTLAGMYVSAAVAGLASGVKPQQGLTNVTLAGFDDLASRTKDYFSASQLNTLASSGIWIATEDRDGTPHNRHGLTTSTLDLKHKEEMIRRNVDSVSYQILARLKPYIGRANATPALLKALRYEVMQAIKYLKNSGFTNELGGQIIDGTIATDEAGKEILRIHPLAADRVELVLNLTFPAPLNSLDVYLVI